MKTTLIPAQITTVEDRIAGNLGFNQILLLISSFIVAVSIYLLAPPRAGWSYEKLVLILVISGIIASLSIRVNQRILLDWIRIISVYLIRPRWYVADKNSLACRQEHLYPVPLQKSPIVKALYAKLPISIPRVKSSVKKPKIKLANSRDHMHQLINQTRGPVRIIPGKGGVHVELG